VRRLLSVGAKQDEREKERKGEHLALAERAQSQQTTSTELGLAQELGDLGVGIVHKGQPLVFAVGTHEERALHADDRKRARCIRPPPVIA